VGVCVRVCFDLFVDAVTLEPFDVSIINFFAEQDMVKNSDKFENGSIPMHCGSRVSDVLVYP